MKFIKRFALRIALNREQRVVLWRALRYSAHKYRAHGNAGRAQAVARIISQVEGIFDVTTKNFTEAEVGAMLNELVAQIEKDIEKRVIDAYERGRRVTASTATQTLRHGRSVEVGDVVEIEEAPNENEVPSVDVQEDGTTALSDSSNEQKQ